MFLLQSETPRAPFQWRYNFSFPTTRSRTDHISVIKLCSLDVRNNYTNYNR